MYLSKSQPYTTSGCNVSMDEPVLQHANKTIKVMSSLLREDMY